jgi:phospholipid/cholesterol/gamma-HCH transport system permease protein
VTLAPVRTLGLHTIESVADLGRLARFAGLVGVATVRRPWRLRRLVRELYDVGVLSLPIILVSGGAVGMVLGLQGYTTLVRFGAESSLGSVVSLTLVRELGPVLTALLVTGRAGSAVAAEIGTMVATEQLDGLRMMSVDPIDFVVQPKAMALALAMPLLSALFIVCALFGGYFVGVELLGVYGGDYLSGVETSTKFVDDVLGSFLKAAVFGVLVALIATHRGYSAQPNAEGVSRATTSTVVFASVTTLLVDYLITALWGV